MDEYRTLRDRLSDLEGDRSRARLPRPQERYTYAGQVYSGGAIPTTVPAVFLTHPVTVDASEAEGSTPTITAGTASVPVLVLGPGVPVAGNNLAARMAGNRWVAMYPGSTCSATDVFTVTDYCTGAAIVSATVSASGPGTSVSGLTDAFGQVTLSFNAAGDWTITVSKTGYTTLTTTVTIHCGDALTAALKPQSSSIPAVGAVVSGCNSNGLVGATVAITGPVNSTGTTSLVGGLTQYTVPASAGSYTIVVSKSRFASTTLSGSVPSDCSSGFKPSVNLSPATGYACPNASVKDLSNNICADPVPTTLTLSDSQFGTTTLTYNGSVWVGCMMVNSPKAVDATCSNQTGGSVPLRYVLDVNATLNAWRLTIYFPNCGSGFFGSYVVLGQTCAGYPWTNTSTSGCGLSTVQCLPLALTFTDNNSFYRSSSATITISE